MAAPTAKAARPLVFGVSRSNGGPNLLTGAHDLARLLAARLRSPVEVHVDYDYEKLLESVLSSSVGLAWMPPLIHARASAEGAQLVAVSERGGSLFYRSAILVRTDGPIQSLASLGNGVAAWVDRNSASGYVFPRLHLQKRGVKAFRKESFHGSASAACAAVAGGQADLCACFLSRASNLAQAQAEVEAVFAHARGRLRVLEITDPIPPDGLVVARQVGPAERSRIVAELLSLHKLPDGRAAIGRLFQAERLVQPDAGVLRMISRLQSLQT